MGWSYFDFARAVRDADLPSAHKAVLWGLGLRADPTGSCYPGHALMSDDSGVSERHIRRVLGELLGGAFIYAQKRHGRSAIYQLTYPKVAQSPTPDTMSSKEATMSTPDKVATPDTMSATPATMSGVPRTPCPPTPDTMSADLPKELPKELPKKKPRRRTGPRGTRIPEDWKPSEPTVLWCRRHGLNVEEIPPAAEEFIDFWTARVPDGKEVKTARGWQAAFKNRIRGSKFVDRHPSYREREREILPPKAPPAARARRGSAEGAELLRKVAAGEMTYEQLPAAMQSGPVRAHAEREIRRLQAEMGGQQKLAIGGVA